MSVIAGSAAGILGLTGYTGFIFYGVVLLFTSFIIWAMKTKGQPGKYFKGKTDVWIDGVFGSLFSYVLFWTLLYGTVHGEYLLGKGSEIE